VRLWEGGKRSERLFESRGSFAVVSCAPFDNLRTALLGSILSSFGDGNSKVSDAEKLIGASQFLMDGARG
jgi:hypothetical protein